MQLPFFGGAYKGPSVEANPQECINYIAEVDGAGGLNSLVSRPGLIEKADLSTEELGDEILTNGAFTGAATSWTLGDKWAYSSNNIVCANAALGTECVGATWTANNSNFTVASNTAEFAWLAGTSGYVYQAYTDLAVALKASEPYQVYFQVVDPVGNPPTVFGAGTDIIFKLGGTDAAFPGNFIMVGTARSANGTFTETITTAVTIGTTTAFALALGIYQNTNIATTKFKIQNMSVKRILAGQTDSISQAAADMAGALTEGATYRLTFVVSGYSGGYLTPTVGGTSGTAIHANGTYSQDIVCGSGTDFEFNSSGAFVATLDTVSLKELVIPQDEIRGFHIMGDYLYAVHGEHLVQLDSTYAATTITTSSNKLGTTTGPVTMAHNFNASGDLQLMICDGTSHVAYIYDETTGDFTMIRETEDAFYGGGSVAAQDGYFISNDPDSHEFYVSSPNDGLTWDVLDVTTAEAKTSPLQRMVEAYQTLWAFKGDSIEEFYDSGSDPIFQRTSLALKELGLGAFGSVILIDNAVMWLADDKTSRMSRGSDATIVSTNHIAREIEKFSTYSDAIGFGFMFNNHALCVLNFPAADRTFVYDLSTGIWVEWKSFVSDGAQDDGRFRGNCYAQFNGEDIVGDYINNKIYKIDQTVYTDDTNRIRRVRVFRGPKEENRIRFAHEFELDLNTGGGTAFGTGSAPQAMLQISRDGGNTYGREVWSAIGPLGTYLQRAVWRQLGTSRDWVFKTTISEPIQDVIVGAYLRGEAGID